MFACYNACTAKKSESVMRQVLLYPSEGWWVAECPSLPGAISQGTTREDAIANIKEAIVLVLEVMHEHGDPIPPPRLLLV